MPGLLPPFIIADRIARPQPCYPSKRPAALSIPSLASCPCPAQFCLRSPPPVMTERCISTPCTPTPRRRARACLVTQRRRRLGPRVVEYRPEPPQPHVFDKLPWITSLDQPPNHNVHPADIADLSQLPDPDPVLPHNHHIRASGPGPIRRRKPSLRSSPLPAPSTPTRTPTRTRADDDSDDDNLFHLNYNLFPRNTSSRPSTPMSKVVDLDPRRVTFRHLMPVVSVRSDDDEDADF